MVPYYRFAGESTSSMNNENFQIWDMITTPYKLNSYSSSSDNSNKAVDTNHVNAWYRYTQYAAINDKNYTDLFNKTSLNYMSYQITIRLDGVHPEGKNIVVPENMILSVADSFYQGTQNTLAMLQEMIILHIVDQIKTDYEITADNNKLDAWVMKYSMETGLKQFNDVKLNENRRTHFYSWNY